MLPFKGKPIINHIVDKIADDIEILVNINLKFEDDFRQWQNTLSRGITLCVEPVYTNEQKLGAIGSLDYWIKYQNITDDLLVIAGDNYFELELSDFIQSYSHKNAIVAVYDIGDKNKATEFGVVRLRNNRIVELQEKPFTPKSRLVATAIWIIPPRIFPIVSDFCSQGGQDNLGNFIVHLLARGEEVYAHQFSELWLDIGSINTYLATR